MQMRGQGIGIAAGPHIADDFTAGELLALAEAVGVVIQVGVVIGELVVDIELVDGESPALAVEQFFHPAGGYRQHRCAQRRRNIDGLMAAALTPGVGKLIVQSVHCHAHHRHRQQRRGRAH